MASPVESKPAVTVDANHTDTDQFRLLVENVVDYAIFALDPTGNVMSWNRGAEKIKGNDP